MRVGIFDPGFQPLGHYIFFNRYVAELLDAPQMQIYFLDVSNKMKSAYEENLKLYHAPIFVSLAAAQFNIFPMRPLSLIDPRWWKNRIAEYFWYRKIFSKMAELRLDVVIFSSVENTPVMYFAPIPFSYIVLVLYPKNLFKTRSSLKGYKKILWPLYTFYIKGFYLFLNNARLLFTTNEPSIPTPELARFFPLWLPNRSFKKDVHDGHRYQRSISSSEFTFLTIGTISNFKNHLFAIDAFEKYKLPFKYLIAGAPIDEVGESVKRRLLNTKNKMMTGIFKNLDDEEYDTLTERTEFMLLPYDFKRGAISSQVMHDAFAKSIPIVAPDVEPFKYYIKRYGVGLIYKEGDPESFVETLYKAAKMHRSDFEKRFELLHDDLSFTKVKRDFLEKVVTCLSSP
jgi:glycosyltransferase involved in cell wall biosynthesis